MKKVIAFTLASCALFTSQAFADNKVMPVTTSVAQETQATGSILDTMYQKYDVVLRNNVITADNDYNSKTYYTKKIKTSDIVVPDEIKQKAKKIYFLVEEGRPYYFYGAMAKAEMDSVAVEEVKKEYNYRVVQYTPGKEEYVFNSQDLVKDFAKGEASSLSISLIAEFSDTQKMNIASSAYIYMGSKENILETLRSEKNKDESYFGYYDTKSLEDYLEKISAKLSRADYKKTLTNAQNKVKAMVAKNETAKKDILNSISKESDFEGNVDKYATNRETDTLLRNVGNATKSQLQKITLMDAIDKVFEK